MKFLSRLPVIGSLFAAPAIVPSASIMPISRPGILTRRHFVGGLIVAPAIIRIADLMPISVAPTEVPVFEAGLHIYDALGSWVPVAFVDRLGKYGDFYSSVEFGRPRKAKGARDAGIWVAECFASELDPGQNALRAAELGYERQRLAIAHKNGKTEYFDGLVLSRHRGVGEHDNFVRSRFEIAALNYPDVA